MTPADDELRDRLIQVTVVAAPHLFPYPGEDAATITDAILAELRRRGWLSGAEGAHLADARHQAVCELELMEKERDALAARTPERGEI